MMAHNIIPALGSPRREDREFEASLGCAIRPSLKENYKLASVVMHTFDPGIRDAETVRDLDEFKDSKGHVRETLSQRRKKKNLKPTIITFRSQFSSVLGTHSTPGSNK